MIARVIERGGKCHVLLGYRLSLHEALGLSLNLGGSLFSQVIEEFI